MNGEKLRKNTKNLSEFASSVSNKASKQARNYGKIKNREDGTAPKRNGIGGLSSRQFVAAVSRAKENLRHESPNIVWRVDAPNEESFKEKAHIGSLCHRTPKGSTIAISQNGNIWGLCKDPNEVLRGSDLLAMAVKAGGTKLDSYAGNHKFYVKNGFEPVSWCKWNEEYAPPDWKNYHDTHPGLKGEDVIFYRYVGIGNVNPRVFTLSDFKNNVPASEDYDTAEAIRDTTVKKG